MKYPVRICVTCEREFTPWRSDQTACSRACGIKRSNRLKQERKDAQRTRNCSVCDEPFRSIRGAETCSPQCYLRRPEVKTRRREALRAWHSRPEAAMWRREKAIRLKYGIDLDEYDAMLEAQGGVCAICEMPPDPTRSGPSGKLHIDHCHQTGRVRGLLCGRCNPGLGYFQDDPERLLAAARYLLAINEKEQAA